MYLPVSLFNGRWFIGVFVFNSRWLLVCFSLGFCCSACGSQSHVASAAGLGRARSSAQCSGERTEGGSGPGVMENGSRWRVPVSDILGRVYFVLLL